MMQRNALPRVMRAMASTRMYATAAVETASKQAPQKPLESPKKEDFPHGFVVQLKVDHNSQKPLTEFLAKYGRNSDIRGLKVAGFHSNSIPAEKLDDWVKAIEDITERENQPWMIKVGNVYPFKSPRNATGVSLALYCNGFAQWRSEVNEQLGDELRHVPHQLIRLTTSPEESEKLVQEISSARQNKELKGGPWSPQRWPQIQGIRIMQPPTLEDQTAELPKGFTYYFSREAFSAKLKRFVPKTEGAEGN